VKTRTSKTTTRRAQKRTERPLGEEFTTNLADSLPSETKKVEKIFEPYENTERTIQHYERLLGKVRELFVTWQKAKVNCDFGMLWDQAKREVPER